MITTIADQYLAQNAGRRYPLADDTPYDGVTKDTAILDFRCTVRGQQPGKALRAYLLRAQTITVSGTAARKRLSVAVKDGDSTVDTLNFDIPMDIAASPTHPYVALATGAGGLAFGEMTVSADATNLGIIPNNAASAPKNVPFAWTTVTCDSLKVRSIRSGHVEDVHDKDDNAQLNVKARLTGEIVLAEGRNAEPYLDGNRLRLDIYKGAGLGERCQSVTSGQTCDNVLFTINGERPGSDGEIRIVGENGVKVTPLPDEHAIEIRLDGEALNRLVKECATACAGG